MVNLGRKFLIACENISPVRSNARRCECGNSFDLGPNAECFARDNSFASPNRVISKSTRDRNGEAICYRVSDYARRGDCESVNEGERRAQGLGRR
jgi:hypothetical protein